MEYAKPWLSVDEQIARLRARGLEVPDDAEAAAVLGEVGYYRLTGYLHPFRQATAAASEGDVESGERYRPGTRFTDGVALMEFDQDLRLLVLEGVERIEVAVRTRMGHTLGRWSAFAHEDPALFTTAFTTPDAHGMSRHRAWSARVGQRRADSDEAFVAHFAEKYDGRMPIWALTEILELGHVTRLYAGLRNDVATEIATSFGVPTKRLMQSWLASVNYVRNVAAHHARLFNRKLVAAPKRPPGATVPLLAHLSDEAPKVFGVYNALAVMAYLLHGLRGCDGWPERTAGLLRTFPASGGLTVAAIGVAPGWLDGPLWTRPRRNGEGSSWSGFTVDQRR
ncbi:Abi family protein [Curtobacterium herbarum]|uniref:Abi family protein n=1 Tax=Curtobacterium herbarum TaxID=150122 RepID=A0ABN1ZCH4_9MICO